MIFIFFILDFKVDFTILYHSSSLDTFWTSLTLEDGDVDYISLKRLEDNPLISFAIFMWPMCGCL